MCLIKQIIQQWLNNCDDVLFNNKTPAMAFTPPAKAFTPAAETKMGTTPGRAVTRELIGGGVYSLISVLPN